MSEYGAEVCSTQLMADSADNFTPWTGTLGRTCVNYVSVGALSLHTSISLCLLKSTLPSN